MAPAQSKLSGNKRKAQASQQPKPAPSSDPPVQTLVCKTTKVSADATTDQSNTSSGMSALCAGAAMSNASSPAQSGAEDDSGDSKHSLPSLPKKDPYAELKKKLHKHRSPPASKHKTIAKRGVPPPGKGKANRVYTTRCVDESEVVIVTHKKTAGEYAFTKTVDDMIWKDLAIKQGFGFDNIYPMVDPENGNEVMSKEYQNKNGDTRRKTPTVYHQKPKGCSSTSKWQKWAKKVLLPYFNKYAQSKYSDAGYGSERFEYGGDLESSKYHDYLSDFLTNKAVAQVMKDDYAYGDPPLSCEDMTQDKQLVEMYFGPNKVDEGIEALLSLDKNFTGDSEQDEDIELKPYESDEE